MAPTPVTWLIGASIETLQLQMLFDPFPDMWDRRARKLVRRVVEPEIRRSAVGPPLR